MPGSITAQTTTTDEQTYVIDDIQNQGYNRTIKVVWVDSQGKKQRTKGQLLMAHDNGIMIRQISSSGRSTHRSIPARSIIKLKYRSGNSQGNDVLAGAFDGLLNGGIVQISTGNIYIDLLSGALTGALSGLIRSPRNQHVVWVNRDSQIYRDEVLPELGFRVNREAGAQE